MYTATLLSMEIDLDGLVAAFRVVSTRILSALPDTTVNGCPLPTVRTGIERLIVQVTIDWTAGGLVDG